MKNIPPEIIQQRFDQVPEEIRNAVNSPEVNDLIESISKKNNLSLDQMEELSDITLLVMLNLVPGSDFAYEFSKEAKIDLKNAQNIVNEINQEVFSKIRTIIRSSTEEKIKDNTVDGLKKVGDISVDKTENQKGTEKLNAGEIKTEVGKAGNFEITDSNPLAKKLIEQSEEQAPTSIPIPVPKPTASTKPETQSPPIPTPPKRPDSYREPIE